MKPETLDLIVAAGVGIALGALAGGLFWADRNLREIAKQNYCERMAREAASAGDLGRARLRQR